jgi:hypothetical protein
MALALLGISMIILMEDLLANEKRSAPPCHPDEY